MRKDIYLPALALAGGGIGFLLRRWQLNAALDLDTNLFLSIHPSTLALLAFTAGMTLLFLLLSRGGRPKKQGAEWLFCPNAGYMSIMTAAALLLLASALLGALDCADSFVLWRFNRSAPLPVMDVLCVILSLPAAWAVLMLGRSNYRCTVPAGNRELSTLPAYAALPWLVSTYQDHSREPQLMRFVFQILAIVLLLLALYLTAALFQGKARPNLLVFCSLTGIYLGLLSLADISSRGDLLRQCGFILIVFGNLCAMLSNLFAPARLARAVARQISPTEETSAPDAAGDE